MVGSVNLQNNPIKQIIDAAVTWHDYKESSEVNF